MRLRRLASVKQTVFHHNVINDTSLFNAPTIISVMRKQTIVNLLCLALVGTDKGLVIIRSKKELTAYFAIEDAFANLLEEKVNKDIVKNKSSLNNL